MKNKIPDRWLDYSPMGSKVAGTRFIAFKAPLSKEICAKMKPSDRFTPDILMERCPNMRLIIDLTNTDRYYNKQEFIDRGIQYEKIMCPGQVIPPQSLIFRFFEIIDDFYLKNGLKDVLIGIHCTHGVNRTGYFIGRYMVQRMGFHFEKAIPCIEEARGHKIERTNYIKDLKVQVPIPSSLSSSSENPGKTGENASHLPRYRTNPPAKKYDPLRYNWRRPDMTSNAPSSSNPL